MNKIKLNLAGKEYEAKVGTKFLNLYAVNEDIADDKLLFSLLTNRISTAAPLLAYSVQAAGGDLSLDEAYDIIDEVGVAHEDLKKLYIAFVEHSIVHLEGEAAESAGKLLKEAKKIMTAEGQKTLPKAKK